MTTPTISFRLALISVLAIAFAAPLPTRAADTVPLPVSVAAKGFTPEQSASFRANWTWQDLFTPGDAALYANLHFPDFYPSALISHSTPTVPLERALDPAIGAIRIHTSVGDQTLDDYLLNPKSRAQAMIVVHHGKIAFETYPGMREDDSHLTFSVGKTTIALVIALLEADGKVDVRHTIGSYVPALRDTAWNDLQVIDVLNMATGLDVKEGRLDPADTTSTFARFVRALFNVPLPNGQVESQTNVIRSAKRLRAPGEEFEYSSLNSQVLVLLAEAVEHHPWAEIFQQRVWSKVSAESDIRVTLTPDGVAIPCGFVFLRLRDLARLGLLYTPSWPVAAKEQIVSAEMIKNIQTPPSPPLKAHTAKGEVPAHNNRQWDQLFPDSDFFKSGLHGQGLYISPDKDLVIAWFSTTSSSDLLSYARAVSKTYTNAK